jgi:hypothetical protein
MVLMGGPGGHLHACCCKVLGPWWNDVSLYNVTIELVVYVGPMLAGGLPDGVKKMICLARCVIAKCLGLAVGIVRQWFEAVLHGRGVLSTNAATC